MLRSSSIQKLIWIISGNNVEEAKKILAESGMKITVADGFNEAARLSVQSAASV